MGSSIDKENGPANKKRKKGEYRMDLTSGPERERKWLYAKKPPR